MTTDNRKTRVLLLAEACNPEWSSVPLLAYYWYRALLPHVDITLVTQIRNKPAFDRCTPNDTNVVFIDTEWVAATLHKLGRVLLLGKSGGHAVRAAIAWPSYIYFEHLVWRRFRNQLRAGEFDLVHRLTPTSSTFPSPLAKWSPVPFILGPVNGSLPWPAGTESIRKKEREWLSPVRGAYRLLPYWRSTFRHADTILAGAQHAISDFPTQARQRTVVVPENGVDIKRFCPSPLPKSTDKFVVLFVGRFIPLKQPVLVLDAIAKSGLGPDSVRVIYVGSGPEEDEIRRRAGDCGLSDYVEFSGWVSQEQLVAYYQNASVLALPSLHESGGGVLLEAMACGLPCIVLDHGGPGEYINADVGMKIPPGSYDAMVAGFAQAFADLASDHAHLERLAVASRALVELQFAWDVKARHLVKTYKSICSRATRPGVA